MLESSHDAHDTPYRPDVCTLVLEADTTVDELLDKALPAGATILSEPTSLPPEAAPPA